MNLDGLLTILKTMFIVCVALLICISSFQFFLKDSLIPTSKKVELGMHYQTQCKLIETNIDNGLFSANTNKIECNGITDNVNMDDYNTAVSAYQNSLK